MYSKLKIGIVAAILAGSTMAMPGTANAWGCIAVAGDGTYGYSYNFDDRDSAIERALNECATRTTTDETCEITECDENT